MKKAVCLLLAIVLVISCATAMAGGISSLLKKTAKTVAAYAVVNAANATVNAVVKTAQATKRDDGALAAFVTDCVTDAAKKVAEKLDAQVECTYENTVIDGNVYAIDPLKVIPVGGGGGKH